MALASLLAEEGGVCGKLNDSNCCLLMDDNGKVVKQITKQMRKWAHVPVQTWKGRDWDPFFWLPGGPWVKRTLFLFLCVTVLLLMIPWTIPCFAWLTKRILKSMTFVSTSVEEVEQPGEKRKTLMVLQTYKPRKENKEIRIILEKSEEKSRIVNDKKMMRDCNKSNNSCQKCREWTIRNSEQGEPETRNLDGTSL